MDLLFFLKSFLVGIMASSSMGPIFILTVSRSILHGFSKGFVTAVGSSLADSIYFSLALFGVLHFLKTNPYTTITMNILSTIILLGLSIKMLLEKECDITISSTRNYGFFISFVKSFFITLFNPLLLLFFLFISSEMFTYGLQKISHIEIILSSLMVFLGSLFMLSITALFSHKIGKGIAKIWLQAIFRITGIILFFVGLYFLYQTILNVYNLHLLTY